MNKYTNCNYPELFSEDEVITNRWLIFQESKLGRLHQSVPFFALGQLVPEKTSNKGAPSWFDGAGMFALMFLKSYLGLSDEKLIERVNTDWELQLFCGVQFKDNQRIKDINLPSRIRSYLANNIEYEQLQQVLIEYWKGDLEDTHCALFDATAYESYIKYPTDEKLLWDCCLWVFNTIFAICKKQQLKRPRTKFKEQQKKQLAFSKTKKKTYKLKQRRKKSLLYLLYQGIGYLEEIIEGSASQIRPTKYIAMKEKLKTIHTVHQQQKYMFDNPGKFVQERIVSLFKPYLRPIVRGKENKRVEFGAKIHMRQVDGINIIDKLDFEPYNETTLLKGCVIKHKQQFGSLHQLGVDNIYGSNKNRRYLTKNEIYTCLPRKGRPSKEEPQLHKLRIQLGKERATVLEGSFGNEKNHYGLLKVKARTLRTEILWIVIGIMTANAMKISKKKQGAPSAV